MSGATWTKLIHRALKGQTGTSAACTNGAFGKERSLGELTSPPAPGRGDPSTPFRQQPGVTNTPDVCSRLALSWGLGTQRCPHPRSLSQ